MAKVEGGVSTLWIYDLTIFNKLFYDKALLAYRNNHIHIVETPPPLGRCFNYVDL
jgi:hypothetical protein